MSTRALAAARAWYRQPMVWLIIAIPASSVVMGVVMLWLAIASYDGLVADDYYKRGMQINRVLDRERAAERSGLSAQLDFKPGVVILDLHAVAEGFRMPPTLNLDLSYATRAGRDQRLLLVRSVAGDYRAPSPALGVGRYYVQASGEQWRITGVLDVPGSLRTRLAPPRAR
jgi:hypothetical protein